jgi:hypothetical protein
MAQSPRIIRLETQSATQDVKDNIYEDIFLPFDGDGNYLNVDDLGDYEYIGFDGENHVYADGKGKRFFSKIGQGIKKGAQKVGQAGKWIGSQIGKLVTKFGKAIRERKRRRAKRHIEKLEKAQVKAEADALAEAEKMNLPPEEKKKFVEKKKVEAVKKAEVQNKEIEQKVEAAETQAYNETLAKTNDVEKAEKAANDAGLVVEGGYGIETDVKVGFWSSMSTGAKIGLIGGGVLVVGLIVWGVVASKNNK